MLLMLEPLVTQGQVTVKPKPKNTLYVIMTRLSGRQRSGSGPVMPVLAIHPLSLHLALFTQWHYAEGIIASHSLVPYTCKAM